MTAHVLFVDDEQPNLIVWKAACADDFRVLCARSAREALELMQRHEIAVVLADQCMPQMTGVELLERVRREYPDTMRILITAYSDLSAAIDAINRGQVRRYLKKPCPTAELKAELEDAVDHYELRRRVCAMERRLVLTERVYAVGLVAAGLGRELDRPARRLRERIEFTRSELRDILDAPQQDLDARVLNLKLTELEAHLSHALESVERMLEIAHSVGLPNDGRDVEEVDVHEVVRGALRAVRGDMRSGAEVQLDLCPAEPVCGNAAKLGQVVLNLLASAIEAASTKAGGGGLVKVSLRTEFDLVRLEVSDNGAPIPATDLPHIFDPFRAASEVRGYGLGLAISKAIVEEMGGTLDVANPSNGGAFFSVTLPPAGAYDRDSAPQPIGLRKAAAAGWSRSMAGE